MSKRQQTGARHSSTKLNPHARKGGNCMLGRPAPSNCSGDRASHDQSRVVLGLETVLGPRERKTERAVKVGPSRRTPSARRVEPGSPVATGQKGRAPG